ncbi:hypothetical protein Sjap_014093 [Stephania japonica]|uniref:Uncharacterized protein n=1 Tax=Stephania japonica TaxID=461633 RepID=A0AAP0IZ65_9MAGN
MLVCLISEESGLLRSMARKIISNLCISRAESSLGPGLLDLSLSIVPSKNLKKRLLAASWVIKTE